MILYILGFCVAKSHGNFALLRVMEAPKLIHYSINNKKGVKGHIAYRMLYGPRREPPQEETYGQRPELRTEDSSLSPKPN